MSGENGVEEASIKETPNQEGEVASHESAPANDPIIKLPAIVGRVVPKDARELLYRVAKGRRSTLVQSIIDAHDYDEEATKQALVEERKKNPSVFPGGRIDKSMRAKEITEPIEAFDEFIETHEEVSDQEREKEIADKTLNVDGEATEAAKKAIAEAFPTGNYLVHGARVKDALEIVESSSLQSILALRENGGKRSKGGYFGISFSYDGVGALPGTPNHLVSFLVSPENALNDSTKLMVPYYAAEKEMQLVPRNADKVVLASNSANADFIGLGMPQEASVRLNFATFKDLISEGNSVKDTRIMKDIAYLKAHDFGHEELQKLYYVEDGLIRVHPDFSEQDLVGATVYLDYLLNYTEQGKQLGKSIVELVPDEILQLVEENKSLETENIKDFSNTDTRIDQEINGKVSIPLEDMVMMVPDSDIPYWTKVLKRTGKIPKAIITYDHLTGPRVPNWLGPEGHKQKAEGVIDKAFSISGVPQASLPFETVAGKQMDGTEMTAKKLIHLKWDVVKNAKDIVKNEDAKLTLV